MVSHALSNQLVQYVLNYEYISINRGEIHGLPFSNKQYKINHRKYGKSFLDKYIHNETEHEKYNISYLYILQYPFFIKINTKRRSRYMVIDKKFHKHRL